MCAAHVRAATLREERARRFPWASGARRKHTPSARRVNRPERTRRASARGRGRRRRERVARRRLPDDLAAGLDRAVQAGGERVGLVAARDAGDQIAEAGARAGSPRREPLGKLARLPVGAALHAHLPGRVAALDLLLFPCLARRLVVPALLVGEPVLDPARPRLDPVLAQRRADHGIGLLGLVARGRVDEDRVAVAGDGEAPFLQLARQLAGLAAELGARSRQQARGVARLVDLDPDAPVVGHVRSSLPARRARRQAVAPAR